MRNCQEPFGRRIELRVRRRLLRTCEDHLCFRYARKGTQDALGSHAQRRHRLCLIRRDFQCNSYGFVLDLQPADQGTEMSASVGRSNFRQSA